jgi:hypothetical protein
MPATGVESEATDSSGTYPRGGLLALYGICGDMYREVGGADAFIRSQRENFGSIVPDYPDQENDVVREKIA